MNILKAYRFRLKTTVTQEEVLRQYTGCARFVYNQALSIQIERYKQGLKKLSYPEMAKELVNWKKIEGTSFLKSAPAQILQQKLMDLDRAYTNFFQKRAGFPKFRKRGVHDSFRFPDSNQINLDEGNSRIQFPKLGWIQYEKSQKINGKMKNVTVSYEAGHFYMSIQTEQEIENPTHASISSVGVDLGIVHLATLSTGEHISPTNSFKRQKAKLAREQRNLARKKKGSQNRQKQRLKISKIHQKIRNCRQDHLHKITTQLSKNHAIIVLEDLVVSNMSRSAAGTLEKPGKNVRAKSGLNRSILDQGWGEFRRQLDYKQTWRGGKVIVISPQYTSQTCSCCGNIAKENRPSQEIFACLFCGLEMNADVNAAKNILAAGHAVIACGEDVRPKIVRKRAIKAASMKQEPTKKTLAAA